MEQYEFIGNLAADARVIKTADEQSFISFCVAVSRRYKNKQGEQVERTKWIDCTRNGDEKFAQYLTKGRRLFVRGDVDARAYMDKNQQPQAALVCRAREVLILDRQQTESGGDVPF